jgi:hypothetical protein
MIKQLGKSNIFKPSAYTQQIPDRLNVEDDKKGQNISCQSPFNVMRADSLAK